MAVYASLAFAYKRSIVLLSLVGQSTYWWKVGKTEYRLVWLKSPVMVINAVWLFVSICVCVALRWTGELSRVYPAYRPM